MKILKLLNKKNLSILLSLIFFQNSYSTETVDIWDLDKQLDEDNINNNEIVETEDILQNPIFGIQSDKKNDLIINEEKYLLSKNINITGIYDPADNNLSMDMWENSNGLRIVEIMKKIQSISLSEDASNILNIALLTNSYFPNKNITKEQFLKIKSDWLIKQKNFDLIEMYLEKNKNLENGSNLIKYYLDHYLSRSDLGKACEIFDKINILINDDYISKFNIYCLINLGKNEEAQLQFDLLKEIGFKDNFFEQKYVYLVGYDENITGDISEESLLDLFSKGEVQGTTHTYIGMEATGVGVISSLNVDKDYVISNHRNHGHYLAFKSKYKALLDELKGKQTGASGGKGGSQVICDQNFVSNGILGSTIALATGIAFGIKRDGKKNCVLCFMGDGALGEGVVYESFNMASLWGLPIIYVLELNQMVQSTDLQKITAGSIQDRFKAFGIKTKYITSTNVFELIETDIWAASLYFSFNWHREKGEANEIEYKLLLERDFLGARNIINFVFENEFGSKAEGSTSFKISYLTMYKKPVYKGIKIGFGGISNFGQLDNFDSPGRQKHQIGPGFKKSFHLTNEMEYSIFIGPLIGLTNASADNTFMWNMEFEF